MLLPTLVMVALAVILLCIAYAKGGNVAKEGMIRGVRLLVNIMPLLLCAFIVAGMVQVLIPSDPLTRLIGAEAGWRGIIIGCIAGGVAPGGPYVVMPMALVLIQAGASIGMVVAFLTSWGLCSLPRLPLEVGILGWKVALIRLMWTSIFPPIAGALAQMLFGKMTAWQ